MYTTPRMVMRYEAPIMLDLAEFVSVAGACGTGGGSCYIGGGGGDAH